MTDNGVRHEPESATHRHQRALANGFGTAMGTATELALLPAIFGTLGWLLDQWLGTTPLFLISFLVFAFIGMFVRAWLGYDKEIREQEAGLYTRLGRRTPLDGDA